MRQWASLGLGIVSLILVGCSGTEKHRTDEGPTTTALAAAPTLTYTPAALAAAFTPTAFANLETVTDPYADMSALLDGVCFEFLYGMNGQTWLWTTPDNLSTFYDQVDASKQCAHAVERRTFDFNGYALAGAVNTSTGCDAAYRVLTLAQDDNAHTQTLSLEFAVLPGCPYELVQPLLIAVPRPPDGYRFNIAVTSP